MKLIEVLQVVGALAAGRGSVMIAVERRRRRARARSRPSGRSAGGGWERPGRRAGSARSETASRFSTLTPTHDCGS